MKMRFSAKRFGFFFVFSFVLDRLSSDTVALTLLSRPKSLPLDLGPRMTAEQGECHKLLDHLSSFPWKGPP